MANIDYQSLLDEAMLDVFKKAMILVEKQGLDEDQSFYISFFTDYPGVILSNFVKKKYPKEITIVLQYQYRNLIVKDDHFSVSLSFGGIPETITVPFNAMIAFVDPESSFSLQFKQKNITNEATKEIEIPTEQSTIQGTKQSNVIAFDKFRKK